MTALDERGLTRDTIVVFLTDNGPQQVRYNSGMLDRKTSTHEGGIRVPGFIRWPAALRADRVVDRIAAHIDITPTILDACGVSAPKGVDFDGKSLLPLLRGDAAAWPDRTLFAQWHRGDVPERYRAFSARTQRYKLVRTEQALKSRLPLEKTFELYDMQVDPFEMHNIAEEHPDVVSRLRAAYDRWFDDVSSTRGYDPPRIALGAPQENPTTLTRQDWRGPDAAWTPKGLGYWEIRVARPGTYAITLHLDPVPGPAKAHLALRGIAETKDVAARSAECTFDSVALSPGPGRLEAWTDGGGSKVGVLWVDVERRD
jgi:hypothetical protein